jgi:hypothetical protein
VQKKHRARSLSAAKRKARAFPTQAPQVCWIRLFCFAHEPNERAPLQRVRATTRASARFSAAAAAAAAAGVDRADENSTASTRRQHNKTLKK